MTVAQALGDPSVTLEQVTPSVFSSGPLFPSEVTFQLYLLFFIFCDPGTCLPSFSSIPGSLFHFFVIVRIELSNYLKGTHTLLLTSLM